MIIDILLSTYNGEKYLKELINSILLQTSNEWRLLIRDDGSSDDTISIIEYYTKRYPNKIIHLTDNKKRIGSTLSFTTLLKHSSLPYIMFCDQDDYWKNDKIEKTLNKMIEKEIKFPTLPILIFSDLEVVDSNLSILEPSYIQYHNLDPSVVNSPWKSMALSVAAGCTIMINKKSIKYIENIPSFLTHDHWIATTISYFGKCFFLNERTILYRQHDNNSIGAKKISKKELLKKILSPIKWYIYYKKELSSYNFPINYFAFFYYKIKYFTYRLIGIKKTIQ